MTARQWNILCRFMYVTLNYLKQTSNINPNSLVEDLLKDIFEEGKASAGK